MKRYKKQLLVYILLVILTGVFFYISIRMLDFQQPAQNIANSSTLSPPHASIFAVIMQRFFGSYSANMTKEIIFFILLITAPFWLFSGYYFARKLNLPGIYNEKRISKKQIILIVSTGIVWGVILPLISYLFNRYDFSSFYNLFELFFVQLILAIVFELIFRLFLQSLISFIVNQIFKKYFSIDKILWIATYFSVTLMFVLFYSFKYFHTGTIFLYEFNADLTVNIFVNLPLAFIANIILCRIFISNGVLYSVITRVIIAILNTMILLNIK